VRVVVLLLPAYSRNPKEANVTLILAIALLLLLFGVIGGVAISKFLFLVLIVAGLLALIGFFARTA
jgi:hypothetical protein